MSLAAFHNGDERHNEFSIYIRTEGGWVVSGDLVKSGVLRKLNYSLLSRFREHIAVSALTPMFPAADIHCRFLRPQLIGPSENVSKRFILCHRLSLAYCGAACVSWQSCGAVLLV